MMDYNHFLVNDLEIFKHKAVFSNFTIAFGLIHAADKTRLDLA